VATFNWVRRVIDVHVCALSNRVSVVKFLLLKISVLQMYCLCVLIFRAKFARGLLSGEYSKSTENSESAVSVNIC